MYQLALTPIDFNEKIQLAFESEDSKVKEENNKED
jgi:hypothetical protein